jgi:hypothetical protein
MQELEADVWGRGLFMAMGYSQNGHRDIYNIGCNKMWRLEHAMGLHTHIAWEISAREGEG